MDRLMMEKNWQAESDARTIMESETIQKDPTRLEKARAIAKKMLKEKEGEVEALRKLSGAKMDYSKSMAELQKQVGGK
jgi:DNA-dependent RNA polymerase auxiliary subunit epsilon